MNREAGIAFARKASVVALGLGLVGLLGWVFEVVAFKSVLPGLSTMKVNTALGLVVEGLALRLLSSASPGRPHRRASHLLSLLVAMLGALTLFEMLTGVDLGIDEALWRVPSADRQLANPGRMSPMAAICFLFLGLALPLVDAKSAPLRRLSQALVVAVLLFSFVAICGYAYRVDALIGVALFASAAIHTAIGLLLLALGMLAVRPSQGLAAVILQDNTAGTAVRSILPALVLTPFLLGWLQLQGERLGLYGIEFGLALIVTVTTSILTGIALWNAKVQGQAVEERSATERHERFLLELSELLRSEPDGNKLFLEATRRLAELVGAEQCFFFELESSDRQLLIHPGFHGSLAPSPSTVPLSSLSGPLQRELRAGRTVIVRDLSADPHSAAGCGAGCAMALRSLIAVPLFRGGQWAAGLSVSTLEPRDWSPKEAALLQATAERVWLWVEQARSLKAQHSSAEQIRMAIEAAPTGMLMVDQAGKIVLVNAQIERLFGHSRDSLTGKTVEMLIAERFRGEHPHHRADFMQDPKARPMASGRALFGLRKDGSEVPIEIGLNPFETPDGLFVLNSIVDLTERKHAEQERVRLLAQLQSLNSELENRVQARTRELSSALKERSVLLQEIHHRVKNNLQVISSLINLQARQLSDDAGRRALEECQQRVQAIALIHQKLYQSKDCAEIAFSDYTKSLAKNIFHAAGVPPQAIRLALDVEDLTLSLDKAIPCGLILNELISNALKHAFPQGRHGSVSVGLRRSGAQQLLLAVADDGIGMPAGLDPQKTESLGLQLVSTLAEQLGGHLDVQRQNGTLCSILFPLEEQP